MFYLRSKDRWEIKWVRIFTVVGHTSWTVAINVHFLFWNMPFAIEKRISFSALSSKINCPFVWQTAMRIKQDLPAYNAPICLRTEYSEKSRNRTRKESASSNLAHNLRIGAKKLWCALAKLFAPHPRQSNRLFILLLRAKKEIWFLFKSRVFKIVNKPRSPRSETIA